MSDMPQSTSRHLDTELGLHDVQALSSADAVAAFFTRLGYSTDSRTPQIPANLGITAEGTARPIKKIQGYLNHPDVDRRQAIAAIRFLNQPMLKVQVDTLRKAYKDFQGKRNVKVILSAVEELREQFGEQQTTANSPGSRSVGSLRREDLNLICFDFVSGG